MSPAFVLNSTSSVIGHYQTTRRIGYFLFQHSEQIGECTHLANVQPEALTTPVRYHELLLNLILICNFDVRILPESSDESTPLHDTALRASAQVRTASLNLLECPAASMMPSCR